MNRRKYWLILLNPLCLALYGHGLSVVYEFCRYGGVSRRMPVIAGIALAGLVWIVVWTCTYKVRRKKNGISQPKSWQLKVLLLELAVMVSLTGYYGYRIYGTAQPFSGKLGNYLYELANKKEIRLTERSFSENGIDGILPALEEESQAEPMQESAGTEAEGENNAGRLVRDGDEMTFYLDQEHSMSLLVTDAAAGSRFYAFQNGDIYNEDPFDGNIGVAEGIFFLDENTGFILLTYASANTSFLFHTTDGGRTFTQIHLPVEDGAEDMEGNEFGFTPEDMDYIEIPYEREGILYVLVSTDAGEADTISLSFRSLDRGQTWEYLFFSR